MEVKFRCGFWKWPKTPEKQSRMPTKFFVLSSSLENPFEILPKIRQKSVQKSAQKICPKIRPKIRPENPSKQSVQKLVQISVSFCDCDCPDWFCQCQASVEDVDIKPQRIHGLMATLHEGCLQVYICSRDGQIETKQNLKSLVRASAKMPTQNSISLEIFNLA